MKTLRFGLACALATFLAACGGGGGSSNPPPPPPPPAPSALSYPAPPVFTIGTAITSLTPTVTGAPTSYAITPALPAGLTINATSGAVSGTPTAAQSATNHTVTASNAGGSTTAVLAITVRDVIPSITYPRAAYAFATGMAISPLTPTATGGTVVSWQIAPALPAGLAFDVTNGRISGTPASLSASATYVVSATNSGGTDTFDLSIAVESGVLFDLGHTAYITTVQYDGSRILSADGGYRVVLWNAASGERVLTVDSDCNGYCGTGPQQATLSGSKLIVRTLSGFDVYSATDGSQTAHISSAVTAGTTWKPSPNGGYIALQNATQLAIWSVDGTALLTRAGDYSQALLYASNSELRIAKGPAGAQVIEAIALPSGTSTSSAAFNGTFRNWFEDGERFISNIGNTVMVYSRLGLQQDIKILPTAFDTSSGYGNWFWTLNGTTLNIYAVGGSTTPAAGYGVPNSSLQSQGQWLTYTQGTFKDQVSVLDLSGSAVTQTIVQAPTRSLSAFGLQSSTNWVAGDNFGVLVGEQQSPTPHLYSYGEIFSIAGSARRVSAATASGLILNFDATTRTFENQLEFHATKLRMSTDGSILGAQLAEMQLALSSNKSIRLFSLPTGNVIKEWSGVAGQETPVDFEMSAAGDVVGQKFLMNDGGSTRYERRVVRLDDTLIWSDVVPPAIEFNELRAPLRLSPSGNLIGASTDGGTDVTTTNIFTNGMLTSAANGCAAGWLDETHLLVNLYDVSHYTPSYNSARIVGTNGLVTASPALPEIQSFQNLGSNLIYVPSLNVILNAVSGENVWSSTSPVVDDPRYRAGAVGGDHVFFISKSVIRAEPR